MQFPLAAFRPGICTVFGRGWDAQFRMRLNLQDGHLLSQLADSRISASCLLKPD